MTDKNFDPINLQPRHRRSVRLQNRDYSASGIYYITLNTWKKEYWFGEIINHKFEPTAIGEVAELFWKTIPEYQPNVKLGEFVVMPNHFHGIIILPSVGISSCRGVQLNAPTQPQYTQAERDYYSNISPIKGSLSVILRTFKAAVTRWCRENGHDYFGWQRNYHERVIRDEEEYLGIVNYIRENPDRWELDNEKPNQLTKKV